MKLFLRISFIGTAYCGYQVQPNAVSIQQKLCEATKLLFGTECDVCGCSRTDSGVHANDFCVSVTEKKKNYLSTNIELSSIVRAMNTYLPEDIAVKTAEWREDDFHPRYSVKYKEYIYKIYNGEVRSPFMAGRSYFYPKLIDDGLIEKMNVAAQSFVGHYDFKSFMATGSKITDTKRNVIDSKVFRDGDIIFFSVTADGFLYNMVRIMAGTLIEVAEGKINYKQIPAIIQSLDRSKAGRTLPACGLYLNKVMY